MGILDIYNVYIYKGFLVSFGCLYCSLQYVVCLSCVYSCNQNLNYLHHMIEKSTSTCVFILRKGVLKLMLVVCQDKHA